MLNSSEEVLTGLTLVLNEGAKIWEGLNLHKPRLWYIVKMDAASSIKKHQICGRKLAQGHGYAEHLGAGNTFVVANRLYLPVNGLVGVVYLMKVPSEIISNLMNVKADGAVKNDSEFGLSEKFWLHGIWFCFNQS